MKIIFWSEITHIWELIFELWEPLVNAMGRLNHSLVGHRKKTHHILHTQSVVIMRENNKSIEKQPCYCSRGQRIRLSFALILWLVLNCYGETLKRGCCWPNQQGQYECICHMYGSDFNPIRFSG